MNQITIDEVGLDPESRLFVRPTSGDFEHVYRAALEVYWDSSMRRLSHPRPPRVLTPLEWYQQIVAAVADEYGVQLLLTSQTKWSALSDDDRFSIEGVAESNTS